MTRKLKCSPGILLLISACSGPARLELTTPPGWVSALIALQTSRGTELIAREAELRVEELEGVDVSILAIFYDVPLSRFALTEGPVVVTQPSRPIPPSAMSILARSLVDGVVGELETVAASDPRVTKLALPALTDAGCRLEGRCLQLDEGERTCVEDCTLDRGPPPTPPTPPAAIQIAPCPTDWTEQEGECVPPSLPARRACAAGAMQRYGAADCATIGPACPAGDWPSTIPAGRPLRFVHPSGAPGPGGEVSARTIADALEADAIVVLSKGTHLANVELRGQALLGACAAETIVRGAIEVFDGQVEALTIVGERAPSIVVRGTLALQGVILDRRGLLIEGELDADDVYLRDIDGPQAVVARSGSSTLTRVLLEHSGGDAVLVSGGSVAFTDLVVTTTASGVLTSLDGATLRISRAELLGASVTARSGGVELTDVAFGSGGDVADAAIFASAGVIVARRVSIERDSRSALRIDGGSIDFSEGWIRNSSRTGDSAAISVTAGARLNLSRTTISGFGRNAMQLDGESTRALLGDVSMRGSSDLGEESPCTMTVAAGARLEGARIQIRDVAQSALCVTGVTSTASVADVTFSDIRLIRDDATDPACAVDSNLGGRVELRRGTFSDIDGFAALLSGGEGRFEDVAISGALTNSTGLAAFEGSTMYVARAHLRETERVALLFKPDTRGELHDVFIEQARGSGLIVEETELSVERMWMKTIFSNGIDVRQLGVLRGTGVHIEDVRGGRSGLGFGLWVRDGASIELSDSSVSGAAESALRVEVTNVFVESRVSNVRLTDTTLMGSGFGVRLLPETPAELVFERVRLIDNDVDQSE